MMVFCLTAIQLLVHMDVEGISIIAIQFNILLALIICCAQIFVVLIFVVEYYPRKVNPHENLCVYGTW